MDFQTNYPRHSLKTFPGFTPEQFVQKLLQIKLRIPTSKNLPKTLTEIPSKIYQVILRLANIP